MFGTANVACCEATGCGMKWCFPLACFSVCPEILLPLCAINSASHVLGPLYSFIPFLFLFLHFFKISVYFICRVMIDSDGTALYIIV